MNMEERNLGLEKFFEKGLDTLRKKGADYNPNGVAFDEVKTEASCLGLSPETYICVLMSKHWGAIKRFCKDGEVTSEPAAERLMDLSNYCALMSVMLLECKK